jgi:2-methylisocitrate lyase-like PEP mutase family enzyme
MMREELPKPSNKERGKEHDLRQRRQHTDKWFEQQRTEPRLRRAHADQDAGADCNDEAGEQTIERHRKVGEKVRIAEIAHQRN